MPPSERGIDVLDAQAGLLAGSHHGAELEQRAAAANVEADRGVRGKPVGKGGRKARFGVSIDTVFPLPVAAMLFTVAWISPPVA